MGLLRGYGLTILLMGMVVANVAMEIGVMMIVQPFTKEIAVRIVRVRDGYRKKMLNAPMMNGASPLKYHNDLISTTKKSKHNDKRRTTGEANNHQSNQK